MSLFKRRDTSKPSRHKEAVVKVATTQGLVGLAVLVAEDDGVGREILGYLLQKAGVRATLVDNGRAASGLLGKGGFDLAILDVQMPEMSGTEVVREQRGRERAGGLPRLPILALTAYTLESDHRQILEAGYDACLVKPFTLEKLKDALRVLEV